MRFHSVMAFVDPGHDYRQHLFLGSGDRRFTIHDIAMKLYGRLQDLRIMPLDADHVGHAAGPFNGGVVLPFQKTIGLARPYDSYICQLIPPSGKPSLR